MRLPRTAGVLLVAPLALGAQGIPRPNDALRAADTTAFVAVPDWDATRPLTSRAVLSFTLTHPLEAGQRVALLVGNTDVSSLVNVRDRRFTYAPDLLRLPAGASEAVAYIVAADGTWYEVARTPLRVRTASGFDAATRDARADLGSAGMLATGQEPPVAIAGRGTHQDVTLRLGLDARGARDGWEVALQSNALAASRREQRLRWSERGKDAALLDLTDYRLQLSRGPVRASIGNATAGTHRYLLSGFASRGITVGSQWGRAITLDAAMLNGTNVVGWQNMVGVGEPDHRIHSTVLGLELVPARPGAFHVDVSGIDGAVLPRTGVTQGAVTDAERSRGVGVQWSLASATQRVRFAGGVAQSRFTNPLDPTLGTDAVVPVRTETRTARFGELAIQALPERVLFGRTRVALGTTLRHERVDPMFRSVGAYVGADRQDDGAEFTGTVGALAWQGAATRGRDNLAGLTSILTTRTARRAVNLAAPVAALLGRSPNAWLPAATFAWERTTQVGDGVPANGDFSASHVPAQWNYVRAASLMWTWPRVTLAWRWNGAVQDNRQPGRELSDLRSRVHALSLGLTGWTHLSPSLEGSVERQDFAETHTQQRTTRLGGGLQATLPRATGLTGNVSRTWSFDPFAGRRVRQVEFQGELSRGFSLSRRAAQESQGRIFVRYARTRARFLPLIPDPALASQLMWSVNAGSSFRLF
ncbi:MAG: hypothetical protein JNL26_13875 [Gemmatimonadetes bacterium]|nr:hypothetical protein [Gemmatimonadota bacterium]